MGNQKGAALLIAMVAAVILTLLGLSLVLTSSQEFEVSNEFASHEQAIAIADGALNQVKNELRGQSLSAILSQDNQQMVPKFASYDHEIMLAEAGTFASRNPITPLEARNIDFSGNPSLYGTRPVNGLLTDPMGEEFGTGLYFAKLSDNDDGDGNPYDDAFDYQGMIMVVGDGEVEFGGANKVLIGGLYVARIEDQGGIPSFEETAFTLGGNSDFYYSSSMIAMATSLLPLTTLSWREITPDIEPVE